MFVNINEEHGIFLSPSFTPSNPGRTFRVRISTLPTVPKPVTSPTTPVRLDPASPMPACRRWR